MWDRLLVDCHIATLEGARATARHRHQWGDRHPGRQDRPGRQATELAGFGPGSRCARRRLGHAGPDRLPHPSGVRRHPRRRACDAPGRRELRGDRRPAGSRRRSRDRAGVGRRTARAAPAAPPRADAGGVTTVEIKSGYGLDIAERAAAAQRGARRSRGRADRADPARAARAPADQRDRRALMSARSSKADPGRGQGKDLATSVDAFCEGIAFTPDEVERVFKAARATAFGYASTPSNCATSTARSWPRYGAVGRPSGASRRSRRRGDGRGGDRRVLLPGAFYALRRRASRRSSCCASTRCRSRSPPTAIRAPRRSVAHLAMNMACTLFGLTPEEALLA